MKKANFSLQEATVDRLAEYSKQSMIPKSKIVDAAINEWIEKQENK